VLPEQLAAVDERDAGFGEFGLDVVDGAVEIDGAAGVADDNRVEAQAAGVEGRVADTEVVGEAGEKDAGESALVEVAGEAGGGGAVVFGDCGG